MEKDVLFRIGLASHPETGARLKQLADDVRGTMRDIETSVGRVGAAATRSIKDLGSQSVTAIAAPSIVQPTAPAVSSPRFSGVSVSSPNSPMTPTYREQVERIDSMTPANVSSPSIPSPALPTPPVNNDAPVAQGKEDAKRYKTSFNDALSHMTGMTGDELKILSGGTEDRWKAIGKENGEAYRKGLRESMSQSLGLSDEAAGELFGAKGGADGKKQQEEYASQVAQRNKTLDENIAKISALDDRGKSLSRNLGSNFREMAERIEGGSSALAQFASGLGFLTAGNQDFEKFVKTLATIKGVADMGVGTIKMFTNLSQMITVVKDRQEMNNEKQEIAAKKAAALAAASRSLTQVLSGESNELREANARNREHASALDQVTNAAKRAAQAERDYDAAVGSTSAVPAKGKSRGGRFGRAGGLLAGVGGVLGAEAITSFGGGGLMSSLGGVGLDALLGRLTGGGAAAAGTAAASGTASAAGSAAAGAAGGAAGGGAAATAAGTSIAGLAATAGAAAAALGAIALVVVEVKEAFQGTATKAGSLTDTIGGWEARMLDWTLSLVGFKDLIIGGDEAGSKADKEMAKKRKQRALDDIATDASAEIAIGKRSGEDKFTNQQLADMGIVQRLNAEAGRGSIESLGYKRDNLRASMSREAEFGKLYSGDSTDAGKRAMAESKERIDKMRQELTSVNALAQGTAAAGGADPEAAIAEKKLLLSEQLKKTMEEISQIEANGVRHEGEYVAALASAKDLSAKLMATEEESLALIKQQKDERSRANQESLDDMTKRIDMIKRERDSAESTLKSGAERFANMSGADQAAAKRAMEIAQNGGAETLTRRQSGLLRGIGTQDALGFAEKADMARADRGGFMQAFGGAEQKKIDAANEQEKQLKVDVGVKEAININLETDYRRIAAEVLKATEAAQEKNRQLLMKELAAQGTKDARTVMTKQNQAYEKQRQLNKSS